MTLTVLWWIVLAATFASLILNLIGARRRARRGEPTPWYVAGNIPGSLGIVCLASAYLVGIESRLAIALIAASFACLGLDIGLSVRARRRESRSAI